MIVNNILNKFVLSAKTFFNKSIKKKNIKDEKELLKTNKTNILIKFSKCQKFNPLSLHCNLRNK